MTDSPIRKICVLNRSRDNLLTKTFFQVTVIFLLTTVLALSVNYFRTDGIPMMTDWSPEGRLKAAAGEGMVIPLNEALSFYNTRDAVFLDARSPDVFIQGHIAGALNVPWHDVDQSIDLFFEKVPDVHTVIICYCDGEACSLSEHLARMLLDMGYKNVKVLINGWTMWLEKGYSIEKGDDNEP